ncbi:MAG: DUF1080 domain-containing protein [Prolixibacteraceae bacterium]|jgi:sugar phosphate isomerase/epimerase|nr:DUF1080 domain-containing protein [Prolixibacteraceae bacterium]
MNKPGFIVISLLTAFCLSTFAVQKERSLKNPFFVFNNSLNKKDVPFIPYEEQALLLKKYGYDGIEHRETAGIMELKDAFDKQGLKIYADYVRIDIDQKEPYLPEWKEAIPKLKGTEIILWCHIHSEKYKPSDEAADKIIVPILQELADFAKPYGVRLAIYPHVDFLADKAEDSFRLATKANRENVGSVFNLCHFLKTDSEENLAKVIEMTLPKLFAVSVCGADGGDTRSMGWDRLIQPLGQGTFDVYRLVELLADRGYTGPIGLQCYNLKGAPEPYLKQSMEAWKSFKQKYAAPVNSLSKQEKTEGWQLLFDGKSANQWRGINQKSFPEKGWKIENGELVACVHGGAESANGGDIITKKKYGNFILKWEWNMKTKGGNSGLKYFVQEGLGNNKGYGFGLEYQLLDDKYHAWMLNGKMQPNDYHTLGSLYEIYPASADKRPNPIDLWNESMIVSKGNHVEHWLNGKKILEYNRSSNDFKEKIAASKFKDIPGYGVIPEGHLLLQDHGSIIHFRNIKIKELK